MEVVSGSVHNLSSSDDWRSSWATARRRRRSCSRTRVTRSAMRCATCSSSTPRPSLQVRGGREAFSVWPELSGVCHRVHGAASADPADEPARDDDGQPGDRRNGRMRATADCDAGPHGAGVWRGLRPLQGRAAAVTRRVFTDQRSSTFRTDTVCDRSCSCSWFTSALSSVRSIER